MGGSAHVAKTGQTTSYRTGDDGDYENGVSSPSPRFTDNGDGSVCDKLTGLMWAKDANDNGTMTWNVAIDYAENLSLGNGGCGSCGASYTDWRLPKRNELNSLIDASNYNPPLPSGHPFTNVRFNHYWSSTTLASSTGLAFDVSMSDGSVTGGGYKTNSKYVWPVRGGN